MDARPDRPSRKQRDATRTRTRDLCFNKISSAALFTIAAVLVIVIHGPSQVFTESGSTRTCPRRHARLSGLKRTSER